MNNRITRKRHRWFEPLDRTLERIRSKELTELRRAGCTAEEIHINRLLRDCDYCGPFPLLRSNWQFFADQLEMLWPRIY